MSDKWWDMPDDELDDLFREASEKVEIPFDQSAFDKLRHKIDNQPEIATPKSISRKWLLPLILLLLVGVGLVYHFVSKKTDLVSNNSTINTEKTNNEAHKSVIESSESKIKTEEILTTEKKVESETDEKGNISVSPSAKKGQKSISFPTTETHLSNANNLTETDIKTMSVENDKRTTVSKKSTESWTKIQKDAKHSQGEKLVEEKNTNVSFIASEANKAQISKEEINTSEGTINTPNNSENSSKTGNDNTYFSSNWKSKNKQSSVAKNQFNKSSTTNQSGNILFENNITQKIETEEDVINRTNFYGVNHLTNKDTKSLLTDLYVDLPPFIDSLPRPKPTPKVSRFGIRFALSPDINAIENFEYLGFGGSLGLLVEYRLNKRFALQTGIGYSTKKYVGDFEYYHAWPDWTKGHPSKPIEVDGRCKVIDIPINVRFNLLQKTNHSWFISSGVSSYIMLNETYIYAYDLAPTKTTNWNDNSSFYASTLNFSVGFEKKMSKHLSFQAEPYLKTPLKGVGRGLVNLYSSGVFFSTKYSF